MSTRRRLTITLDGPVAIVRGWRAADLVREAGGKPIFAGTIGGWMVDLDRLGDLLAYLEGRGIAVHVVQSDATTVSTCRSSPAEDLVEDGGLW